MQACLARLYVDDSFRRLFYIEPEATVRDYRLTANEREALKNIDREMLDFFVTSLINKRKERMEKAYPILSRIHPDLVSRYYRRYSQVRVANAHEPNYEDVVQFGLFMEESIADADEAPAYASQLARYERLCYCANIGPSIDEASSVPEPLQQPQTARLEDRLALCTGVHIESFSYDVAALKDEIDQSASSQTGIQIEAGEYWILFISASNAGNDGSVLRINYATRALLDLCDGDRTVSQIITQMEETFGATHLEQALRDPIDRLLSVRAIQLART